MAQTFSGRARAAFAFTITSRRIVVIDLVADAERVGQLDLVVLDG